MYEVLATAIAVVIGILVILASALLYFTVWVVILSPLYLLLTSSGSTSVTSVPSESGLQAERVLAREVARAMKTKNDYYHK